MDENGTGTTVNQKPPSSQLIDSPAIRELLAAPRHGDNGPTDAPIRAIHRGPSGYISLAVKESGRTWRQLGAIPIGQPFLPDLLAQLAADGYFGLNTSFRHGARFRTSTRETWQPIPGEGRGEQLVTRTTTKRETINPDTGLLHAQHDTSTLKWLNVAHADLDCYKLGLSVGDAVGEVINLQDSGVIPPATMFARSGRGLWVFWFLVDGMNPNEGEQIIHGERHQPGTPARATKRSMALYAKVQNAIVRKLTHLGADLAAVDPVHSAPMPGTMKSTGADHRVLYWAQATANGLQAYQLPQLAAALGCDLQRREHPIIERALSAHPLDAPKKPANIEKGIKGWKVRWDGVVRDLEILIRLREGRWPHGVSRNRCAFYYAVALQRAGMHQTDVGQRVTVFGERVGLERDEIAHAVKQCKKKAQWSHLKRDTYLRDLDVTPVERSYLDAQRTPAPAPTAGKVSIQPRRDALLDAIGSHFRGKVPSVRTMAAYLATQEVPCGNHSTVHRDYLALGLQPTTKAGRPPKLPL